MGCLQEGWQSGSNLVHRPANPSQIEEPTQIKRERSLTEPSINTTMHKSPEEIAKDKSWESLQRVLDARKQAAQQDQTSMPPPALPRQLQMPSSPALREQISSAAPVSAFSDWSSVASSTPWSTVQPPIDQFIFGFDPLQEDMSSGSDHTPTGNQDTMPAQNYPMDADWTESLHHPVPMQQPVQLAQLNSASAQDVAYPSSRRASLLLPQHHLQSVISLNHPIDLTVGRVSILPQGESDRVQLHWVLQLFAVGHMVPCPLSHLLSEPTRNCLDHMPFVM
jgi:hypothetical protein